MRSLIGAAGIMAAAFGLATALRVTVVDAHAASRREQRLEADVLSSPGPRPLKIAAMEHNELYADILWLQIVQELGKGEESTVAGWDRMERWANIAVDLAQKYYNVYYATSIHLIVYAKRADPAVKLLRKGTQFLPERWELPFLLGYVSYFMHAKPSEAAAYWEHAVTLPDAPRFLPSLAARARFHGGDEHGSIAMLESMLPNLEGPHKEDAEIRIKLLKSEFRLRKYDEACRDYEAQRGERPKDGDQLYATGVMGEPPVDYLDNPITFDDKCIARTKVITIREAEATKRAGSQAAGDQGAKFETDPALRDKKP